MQFRAFNSKLRKTSKRKEKPVKNYSIFDDLASKYAQTVDPGQPLDPTQLQVGQQVYSPEGEPMTVVENPEDTATTTVMPADQAGSGVPQGVQTLDEAELASQYSLQPNEATPAVTAQSRKAQDISWNDIQDIANSMNQAIEVKDMKSLLEALEDMFEIAMSNINMPEDVKVASIFEDYINGR